MIDKTRSRGHDTRESQKEKRPVLILILTAVSQKSRD